MTDDNQPVTRGPNYDWKHEAEHYRLECDKLRELLWKVDSSGERIAWERDKFKAALEKISQNTYGTELCNTDEENNEILASHFFDHQRIARKALSDI